MTIRMRHTRSHSNKRRSHHGLKKEGLPACEKCNTPKLPHTVCDNCGTYKKKPVFDVLKKLTKKERKQKEKELKAQEEQGPQKGLDASELSKK